MAGVVKGVIDGGGVSQEPWKSVHDIFTSMYKFFSASSRHTVLAYNTGLNNKNVDRGVFVPGTDYWDGTNPFGWGAWFLVRFTYASKPFYMLFFLSFQHNTSPTFPYGLSINNTTYSDSNGIGVALAYGTAADGITPANPFMGTMNNNGLDTMPSGSPLWSVPAGGKLYVSPRSNMPGGSFTTNRNSLKRWISSSGASLYIPRWDFYCSDDLFTLVTDLGNKGYMDSFSFAGLYEPRSDLVVPADIPIITMTNNYSYNINGDPLACGPSTLPAWGNMNGGTEFEGSIRPANNQVGGSSSPMTYVGFLAGMPGALFQVGTTGIHVDWLNNKNFGTGIYEEWPIYVGPAEAPASGLCGSLGYIRHSKGPVHRECNLAKTRIYRQMYQTTSNVPCIALPWDGVTIPQTTPGGRGKALLCLIARFRPFLKVSTLVR